MPADAVRAFAALLGVTHPELSPQRSTSCWQGKEPKKMNILGSVLPMGHLGKAMPSHLATHGVREGGRAPGAALQEQSPT